MDQRACLLQRQKTPKDGATVSTSLHLFPWAALFVVVIDRLRLSPNEFWALTIRELFMLLDGLSPKANRFERATLDALMKSFPDGDQNE